MSKDKIYKIIEDYYREAYNNEETIKLKTYQIDNIAQAIQTQVVEPMENEIKDKKVFLDDVIEHTQNLEKHLSKKNLEINRLEEGIKLFKLTRNAQGKCIEELRDEGNSKPQPDAN